MPAPLAEYLVGSSRQVAAAPTPEACKAFLTHLDLLLTADDPHISEAAVCWLADDLRNDRLIPPALQAAVYQRVRTATHPSLVCILLAWMETHDAPFLDDLPRWLSELALTDPEARMAAVEMLVDRYLSAKYEEDFLVTALKRLDMAEGDVADCLLHRFPDKLTEVNRRIISLLGQTRRFRIIKPLVGFVEEYPEYLRAVMKALSYLDYDEADAFFVQCLERRDWWEPTPLILIEAVKHTRKRKLRKAIPALESLFPVDSPNAAIINRAVNGEIALALAAFGNITWARERLISEMILDGVNQKYLKAVDLLGLEEAIPLLKAILLAPAVPEMLVIQHHAHRICQSLLSRHRTQLQRLMAP